MDVNCDILISLKNDCHCDGHFKDDSIVSPDFFIDPMVVIMIVNKTDRMMITMIMVMTITDN